MSESRHRKVDRKRGVRVRRRSGRRRATLPENELSREELKAEGRRRRERARRRRILLAVVAALAMVWGAAVLASWLDGRDGEDEVSQPTAIVPSDGVSVLLAVTDAEEHVQAMALLAAHDDVGTRVVLFHPSLLTTLPGFGENVLSNAVRFDDVDLLKTSVANLLGARIDDAVVWTASEFVAALPDALEVDLPEALIVEEGDASLVVAAPGPASREGEVLAQILTDPGLGDELDLMQRQGAVWDALLDRAAEDARWVEALFGVDPALARQAFVAVATTPPLLTIAPAEPLETSGSEERYQLDGADAATFVERNLAFLQLAEEPRVRIEVLNGNGRIGTTQPVAALLVEQGFRVVVTDNADRDDYATTQVIAQGLDFQEAAVEAATVLGLGDVSVEIRQPSGVVDLTIIVGQDLPAGQER